MCFGAVDWPDKAQFGGACFELLHGEVWGKKKQRERYMADARTWLHVACTWSLH